MKVLRRHRYHHQHQHRHRHDRHPHHYHHHVVIVIVFVIIPVIMTIIITSSLSHPILVLLITLILIPPPPIILMESPPFYLDFCCRSFGFRFSLFQPVEQYFNVSNPVFSILRGNAGNMFVINQTTKELRVGGQGLDREQSAQHSLVVELRSNGINRGFARVRRCLHLIQHKHFYLNRSVLILSSVHCSSSSWVRRL